MGFESSSDISSDENFLNQVKNAIPKVNVARKLHKCDFPNCNKEFSRPSKLKRHQSIHTQEKLFTCSYPNCNKKYSYSWHLKRHVNNVHEKIFYKPKYKCVYEGCTKELNSDFSLRRHIKYFHSENSPSLQKYSCDHCSQSFKKKNQLAAHAFSHTSDQKICCKDCDIVYENIADYKKHISRHKTFTCDCGEVFHRWTKFMSHKRTQHISTYNCDICSKIFRTKVNLKQHKLIHTDTRKVYECTYDGCPKYYYYPQNLSHHIKSYHDAERFVCTFKDCGRRFVSNRRLKIHMETHEPGWKPKKTQKKKKQKPRKDIGIPKKEMAAHLAGYLYGTDIVKDKNIEPPTDEDDLISNATLQIDGCSGVLNIVASNTPLMNTVAC